MLQHPYLLRRWYFLSAFVRLHAFPKLDIFVSNFFSPTDTCSARKNVWTQSCCSRRAFSFEHVSSTVLLYSQPLAVHTPGISTCLLQPARVEDLHAFRPTVFLLYLVSNLFSPLRLWNSAYGPGVGGELLTFHAPCDRRGLAPALIPGGHKVAARDSCPTLFRRWEYAIGLLAQATVVNC